MRFLIALAMVCLLIGAVCAAEQPAVIKVAVDFQDVDAAQALLTLSQKAQVTILGDATVKGKVNCNYVQAVPVDEVLDTICRGNGLEWHRAFISTTTDEKPNAGKILALLDALKAVGNTPLICQSPSLKQQTVFIPGTQPEALDLGPLADSLKLKAVYLVRATPKPVDPNAAQTSALGQAPAEVTAAANQVWNYFSQMPVQQQFQVMRELGNMIRNNMTPETMEQMREMWRRDGARDGGRDGQRGDWRGRDGQRDGQGPPRQ